MTQIRESAVRDSVLNDSDRVRSVSSGSALYTAFQQPTNIIFKFSEKKMHLMETFEHKTELADQLQNQKIG